MSAFFAYLSKMKYIQRWGLMRNSRLENIQEHSLEVALIAHGLAVIRNQFFGGQVDPERVLTLAAFHEVGEVITGDLATPIKYFNPEIKQAYQKIDLIARERLLKMLPQELHSEYEALVLTTEESDREHWQLVKAADKLSAYLKCLEELKVGNQEFSKAAQTIKRQLTEVQEQLPEVGYFMEHFVPEYSLTLDELN